MNNEKTKPSKALLKSELQQQHDEFEREFNGGMQLPADAVAAAAQQPGAQPGDAAAATAQDPAAASATSPDVKVAERAVAASGEGADPDKKAAA